MAPLPPPWTDLGRGLRVRESRLFRMNSVVLEGDGQVAIVDPGILPSEIDDIARAVEDLGADRATLLFTHGDWDHVLGRDAWPAAATLAHGALAEDVARNLESIRAEAQRVAADAGERWPRVFEPFRPDVAASGRLETRLAGWDAVCRDAPGHSPSMLSVHVPALRLLIAGDMLSDIELPILNQPVALYRSTLAGLLPLARGGAIETLIPGHGAVARTRDEAVERIRRDLRYLDDLDREVRGARLAGLTVEQTVARLEAMDLSGWRTDPVVALPDLHRDNVRRVAGEGCADSD
jgi:hydroxyacylglutathione hydrolase